MVKEEPQEIEKAWGHETILVNRQYCAKLLHLLKGASSSRHAHRMKIETFHCIEGTAVLTVAGKGYLLTPFTRPKTIEPGELHSFHGVSDAVILEVSSGDEPQDVERFSESRAGVSWR